MSHELPAKLNLGSPLGLGRINLTQTTKNDVKIPRTVNYEENIKDQWLKFNEFFIIDIKKKYLQL